MRRGRKVPASTQASVMRLCTSRVSPRQACWASAIDAPRGGSDCTVMRNEVAIFGPTSIECSCAHSTSFLLSNNYSAFIEHFLAHREKADEDEILRSTLVVQNGELVNERVRALTAATL